MRAAIHMALWFMVVPVSLAAQAGHAHGTHEPREIQALTPSELEGLLAGEGMGFALAAELNRHPGPLHVLELASDLGLSADQRAQVEAIFEEMRSHAMRVGRQYVGAERALDRFFVNRRLDATELGHLTAEAARLRGELRRIHLDAHLQTTELLDGAQVEAYDRLRGHVHSQYR